MSPKCPTCDCEYLDQGLNGIILCHGCGKFWVLGKPINHKSLK